MAHVVKGEAIMGPLADTNFIPYSHFFLHTCKNYCTFVAKNKIRNKCYEKYTGIY